MKYLLILLIPVAGLAQSIGDFKSILPGPQVESLILPSTHSFQLLWQSGMKLSDSTVLGDNLDFTSYVPLSGSSKEGYTTVSSETSPAKVACFRMSLDTISNKWNFSNSGNVDFSELGNVSNFCSGGVMPWGTVVVAEESNANGDLNADGYEDLGWLIEIDPATKSIVSNDHSGGNGKDKIWAAGRTTHENICVRNDFKTFYFGADNPTNGFLYKFLADNPKDFSSGQLFVLKNKDNSTDAKSGTWVLLPNSTKDFRNNTHVIAATLNATNFNGIEDVEVGSDNRIYFSAKGPGRIFRFKDNNTVGQSNDVDFEVFVENKPYDIDGNGQLPLEPWGIGNDNMAFDDQGNLWVLQDGDRNYIWVVGAKHTPGGDNDIRLFATTPKGSEPTGINFTPDFKYMFISFQHPDPSNITGMIDAHGDSLVFNKSTTLVIARKERLGQSFFIRNHTLPQNWQVVPNPAENEIVLNPQPDYRENLTVKIIDDSGKLVKEIKLSGKEPYRISVSELRTGTYQLSIRGEKLNAVVRMLKR